MTTKQNAMQKSPAQAMNAALSSDAVKNRLAEVLHDNAPAFAASIVEVFSADNYLQRCDPYDIIRECMKAAVLNLPLSKALGFAWVVPFGGSPTFQIGWKGYVQLAQRTGQYKFINAGTVLEGELRSYSKLTGELDIEGDAISDRVEGFFAYIELKNGFSKSLYMTTKQMTAHAIRYNQQCKKAGRLAGVWQSDFEAMGTKTVLATIIRKFGIMSTEMMVAENSDGDAEDRMSNEIKTHAGAVEIGFSEPETDAKVEPVDDTTNAKKNAKTADNAENKDNKELDKLPF